MGLGPEVLAESFNFGAWSKDEGVLDRGIGWRFWQQHRAFPGILDDSEVLWVKESLGNLPIPYKAQSGCYMATNLPLGYQMNQSQLMGQSMWRLTDFIQEKLENKTICAPHISSKDRLAHALLKRCFTAKDVSRWIHKL